MNRRAKPAIEITLARRNVAIDANNHRYVFTPQLRNIGAVSLRDWLFEIDVPLAAADNEDFLRRPTIGQHLPMQRTTDSRGRPVARLEVSDPFLDGRPMPLHPGRSLVLDARVAAPALTLAINQQIFRDLREQQAPIAWRLYMPDSPPIEGEQPFGEWCIY
jgi:hypothetical protein